MSEQASPHSTHRYVMPTSALGKTLNGFFNGLVARLTRPASASRGAGCCTSGGGQR